VSVGGPSALGTLLVQRLDAVLGTTLAQQANLLSGARPDAVAQPPGAQRPDRSDNVPGRDSRQAAERAEAQAQRRPQSAIKDAGLQTALALARGDRRTETGSTASAPTTLGFTARTILALLARYPQTAPALAGKTALWRPPAGETGPSATSRSGGTDGPAIPAPGREPAPAPRAAASAPATDGPARNAALQAMPGQGAPTAQGLARALANVLETSGMFYESHLAQVAFGKREPARLAQEPQARWTTRGPATPAAGSPAPAPRAAPSAPPPALQAGPDVADASSGAAVHATASQASAPAAAGQGGPAPQPPIPGLHPDAALIVRQQLEVLAHQVFAWQGEAWPGAPMRWEIGRDDPAQEREGPATWSTRLTVNLPRLGMVEARIGLAGTELAMHLAAPDSATELQEHAEALRHGCRAAGLTLSGLSVSGDLAAARTDTP